MALETDIQSEISTIMTDYGTSVTVYLSPSHSYDDEGNDTISKGTGTSASVILQTPRGEMVTPEMEGIDKQLVFKCFCASSVGTIDEDTIILYNSQYYKITSINTNPLASENVTFYDLNIERIQPQDSVS